MSELLPDALARLEQVAEEIHYEIEQTEFAARDALAHAHAVGDKLLEAKRLVGHGGWGAWLEDNFHGGARTASRYMQLARHRPQVAGLLTIDNAVEYLAEKAANGGASSNRPDQADLPAPKDEGVAHKLELTAKENPERAEKIWRRARKVYGEDATSEQVAAIAANATDELEAKRKAFSSALGSALRDNDATSAKYALVLLREAVRPVLERVAATGVERPACPSCGSRKPPRKHREGQVCRDCGAVWS